MQRLIGEDAPLHGERARAEMMVGAALVFFFLFFFSFPFPPPLLFLLSFPPLFSIFDSPLSCCLSALQFCLPLSLSCCLPFLPLLPLLSPLLSDTRLCVPRRVSPGWLTAPTSKENMLGTLALIRQQYGSVESYVVDHLGVSQAKVDQLRRNLVVDLAEGEEALDWRRHAGSKEEPRL